MSATAAGAALGPWGAVAGFGIDALTSVFGASSKQSETDALNKQIAAQNKYNMDMYRFGNREARREYRYLRDGVNLQRQNIEEEYSYRDDLARREYNYNLQIADFEFNNARKQYVKSEENYKNQLRFNNIAAAFAYESEDRKLREIMIGNAFASQDQLIENIQSEGAALARGQAGRSAAKAAQSEIAQYGRNLAVLAESISSAERNYGMANRKIGLDKLGADLAAEASRMIMPERAPVPPAPRPLPRPTLQDPLKPKKPPKPVKGAMVQSTLGLDILTGVAGAVGSGLKAFSSFG